MSEQEIQRLRKQAENLNTLIEVSIIINSTLDLDEVVRLVMEKAQQVMNAEASSVLLLNPETGRLEVQSALGQVGAKVKEVVSLELGQGIAGWVAQTGEPLNVPDVTQDRRFYQKVDEMTGFRTRSVLAAPLVVQGRVVGVAEVINRRDGRPFDADDVGLFTTFCRGVAMAVENARMHRAMIEKERYEQQLEAARVIQQSFLPRELPVCPRHRFEVAAYYEPARAIGGDFYEFIQLDDDHLAIILGDVSGKGIPAALFMARLISDLHAHAKPDVSPAQTLEHINEHVTRRSQRGMFVTLTYLILNAATGRLLFSNAGHLPLVHVRARDKTAALVDVAEGIPLGVRERTRFEDKEVALEHGDYVLVLTDGLTEARDARRNLFGMERLLDQVRQAWTSPHEILNHLISTLHQFMAGAQPEDDTTIVAVKWC